MALPIEWFQSSYSRIQRWDIQGLSLIEAEIALETYLTDNNPISLEMADYIAENWTGRRVQMLDAESRRTLMKIWDEREITAIA
ncbi:hypothetical protein [Vibrio hangzhouensis]|uniref:Uncharacterized protein n=1 Tax=Vibrio hangzhouensis TaxID=462991 RepID=A0A1H5YDL3_9VIBR|nr:hypothetical protein [Vibrio hangzhouensis]SEG21815.1 hypothetical protein SAMN04488244_10920 [Vibrio hangzhouensis]